MPVNRLLVEGALDVEVLHPILQHALPGLAPLVEAIGSKGSLAPRCLDLRKVSPSTFYLRDRDFDFPPEVGNAPLPMPGKTLLGWRWSRHELESYLLEPSLVARATGRSVEEVEQALVAAGRTIRDYQRARWVIGDIRRNLPPNHELATRPAKPKNELRLPSDLTEQASGRWLQGQVGHFRKQLAPWILGGAVRDAYQRTSATVPAFEAASETLAWCSGKDLLSAVAPALGHPGNPWLLRDRLRDQVRDDPAAALAALPEWRTLIDLLR